MSTINKVILMGNLGKDPELRKTETSSVVSFSIATSETYLNKAGEKVQETDWHNIVFWNKQAETIAKFFRKGDSIIVEGKLTTRSYEKDGQKRYITEVKGDNWKFGAKKSENNNEHHVDSDRAVDEQRVYNSTSPTKEPEPSNDLPF